MANAASDFEVWILSFDLLAESCVRTTYTWFNLLLKRDNNSKISCSMLCSFFINVDIVKKTVPRNDRSTATIFRYTALCSSYFLLQALPYKYPLPAGAYYFMLHDIIRAAVPSSDMSFAVDCLNFALLFICTRVFHLALGISAQYYKVH